MVMHLRARESSQLVSPNDLAISAIESSKTLKSIGLEGSERHVVCE